MMPRLVDMSDSLERVTAWLPEIASGKAAIEP
jgi:hypothetical protein